MKKILVFILSLFLIIGGILTFIGYSFNAEKYKQDLISNLSNMTGRKVEIGAVDLTWTPFPTMLIHNMSVSNQENSKNAKMFSVEKIYVEISWASLFKNPLVIKRVRLQKPILLLERVNLDRTNFDFPILFRPSVNLTSSNLALGREKFSMGIREVIVENGTFTYSNDLSKENYSIPGISGKGQIDSLNGPFFFEGIFRLDEKNKKIDITVDEIKPSQDLRLKIGISDGESKTKIDLNNGRVYLGEKDPDDWITFEGDIRSEDPTSFFGGFGLIGWPNGKLEASFTLKLMTKKTVFDVIRGYQEKDGVRTSFSLEKNQENSEKSLSKSAFVLTVMNLEYDKWSTVLKNLLKIPFIDQLKTNFDLQLDEIKINSQIIKKGEGVAHIGKGILSFDSLTLQLPYSGSLKITDGNWNLKENTIDTNLELQTEDFSPVMNWAFPDMKKISWLDSIKNVQFRGHVKWEPGKLILDKSNGVFDETAFLGGVEINTFNNLNVALNLDISHLSLDSFFTVTLEKIRDLSIPKGTYLFDLRGEDITVLKNDFKQVNLKGQITPENKLELNEFLIQKNDDSSFKGSGNFKNLGKVDFEVDSLKMDYSIPDLKGFIKENKISIEDSFFEKEGELKGNLSYSGTFEKGNLETNCQFNQLQINLKGEAESLLSNKVKFNNADLSLNYPDVQEFLTLVDPDLNTLFPFLKGDLKIKVKGKGTLTNFNANVFGLTVGKQVLDGKASWNSGEKDIALDLKTPLLNLDYFLTRNIYPFDNSQIAVRVKPEWAGTLNLTAEKMNYKGKKYKDLNMKMALKTQELAVSDFRVSSEKDEEKISFNGNIVFKNGLSMEGNYEISNFSLNDVLKGGTYSFAGGKGSVIGDFATKGSSREELVKNLTGKGNLTWEKGTIYGIDIQELSSFTKQVYQHKQPESEVSVQVQHALSSGKINLNSATSSFMFKKGDVITEELKGLVNNAEIYLRKLRWSLLSNKFEFLFSILLNQPENLPSLELSIVNNKVTNKTDAFEQALKNEIRNFVNQKNEAIEQKNKKEKESKQTELLRFSKQVLDQAESLMNQIQDRLALDPSLKKEESVYEAEKNIQEVRQLVVRSEFNEEQLMVLEEKSKMLEIQLKGLEYFLRRQEVLRKKKALNKLMPLLKKQLEDIVQIYGKNPNSSLLIGLIQGVQKEEKKVQMNLQLLSKTVDVTAAENIIDQIKESVAKIQKAWNYARQADSMGGISSSVSGIITEENFE